MFFVIIGFDIKCLYAEVHPPSPQNARSATMMRMKMVLPPPDDEMPIDT